MGYGSLLVLVLMFEWGRRLRKGSVDYVPTAFDVPMLAFLLICALSTVWGVSLGRSSVSSLSIATAMGGALLVWSTTKTKRTLLRLAFLAAFVGVFFAILSVVKLATLTTNFGLDFAVKNRLWLPLINPNGIAAHFTLTVPLMLMLAAARIRRWLSVLLIAVAVVSGVCLVLSYSKGGIIGFVAAMLALLAMRKQKSARPMLRRRRFATVAVIAVGAILLLLISLGEIGQRALERLSDPISLKSRTFFWGLGERTIARHPVLGVGFDNNYVHTRIAHLVESGLEVNVRQNVLSHSHSTYLHIAEGTGIIGLCAFMFLLIAVVSRGVMLLKKMPYGQTWLVTKGVLAGMIGFAIHGFFDLEFGWPEWDFALFVYIGLIAAAEQIWRRETGKLLRLTNGARIRSRTLYWCCFGVMAAFLVLTQAPRKSEMFLPELAAGGLSLDPEFFESLAEEKIQTGEFDEATELYEKAIARQRDYPKYHEKLGWLYWLRNDRKRASEHFKAAVDLDRLGAIGGEHYSALALFLFAHGEHQRASLLMASAIQTDPKVLKRGIWQFVPRDEDGPGDWIVRKEFITLGSARPGSWEALREQIIAHLKGEVGPANRVVGTDILELVTKLASPGYMVPWSVDVIQHHLYERYLDVLATDPMSAKKIMLNIGKGYCYVGWNDRAESTFKEGLKFFRGDFNFRKGLAVLYASQGKYERAAELFSQTGDSYSEGIAWLLAEQYDRAIAVFSDLLSHHMEHQRPREHARALTMIGKIHELRGGPDSRTRARDCYEKALFLSQSAANYRRLSDILYKLGDNGEAKEMYRRALQLHQEGQPLQDEPLDAQLMD